MNLKENAFNISRSLTWLLGIFSLNLKTDQTIFSVCPLLKSVITVTVFACLTIYCLCYNIFYIYSEVNLSIKLTDAGQMIYDICQYSVDLFFVNKYRRYINEHYFKQYDFIDNILGINKFSSIKRRLLKLVIFFTSFWLITFLFDITVWILVYGWVVPAINSVNYIYLYIKILNALDLTSHVMNIERRLKTIGDFVHEYYSTTACYPGVTCISILYNKNWIYTKSSTRISYQQKRNYFLKFISSNNQHRVKWLSNCYLMLTEQVVLINSIYGIRVRYVYSKFLNFVLVDLI